MMTQTIGRKLRQFRQKKGYSQETLADRAGLHPTYIGQVERGEKNITVETLAKITTALGIPISSVFDDVLSNPSPMGWAGRTGWASWGATGRESPPC